MAQLPIDAAHTPLRSIPVGPKRPPSSTGSLEQPLFRYGLRQLLWFVAVLSTLLAGIVSADGITAAVLLLAALVVAAHVLSTALGSRLRAQSDQECTSRLETAAAELGPQPPVRSARPPAFTSHSHFPWHGRGTTSLPWLPRLILAGALLGAVGGAILLAAVIGHRTSPAGILVGAASLAVLGGWFAFLGGSFYGIFRHGLREALTDQRNDESSHSAPR